MSNRRRIRRGLTPWQWQSTHEDCSCVTREVVPVDELLTCPACGVRPELPPGIPTEAPIGATMTMHWWCSCGGMLDDLAVDVRVVR